MRGTLPKRRANWRLRRTVARRTEMTITSDSDHVADDVARALHWEETIRG
jgi:hypothetical protein